MLRGGACRQRLLQTSTQRYQICGLLIPNQCCGKRIKFHLLLRVKGGYLSRRFIFMLRPFTRLAYRGQPRIFRLHLTLRNAQDSETTSKGSRGTRLLRGSGSKIQELIGTQIRTKKIEKPGTTVLRWQHIHTTFYAPLERQERRTVLDVC